MASSWLAGPSSSLATSGMRSQHTSGSTGGRPLVSKSAGLKWGTLLAQSSSGAPRATSTTPPPPAAPADAKTPASASVAAAAAASPLVPPAAGASPWHKDSAAVTAARPASDLGAGDQDESPQPGFDELPPVPFLLLRVAAPDPPAPLDLTAPPQELQAQLAALQARAAELFGSSSSDGISPETAAAAAKGSEQQARGGEAGGSGRGDGGGDNGASLAFLRTPLAVRHAFRAPVRRAAPPRDVLGEEGEDGTEEQQGDSEAPPAVIPLHQQQHQRDEPQQKREPQRVVVSAFGGHAGPPAKSTASMATSLTGATSHGSMRSDAQSPNAALAGRLRKLKALQQQASALFA